MKYIITENQNENLIIKYLNSEYGDLEVYITNRFPNKIFFFKDKKMYMEYVKDSKHLWIDYDTIWSDLKDKFGLEGHEIETFIKKWAEETYKLRGITKGVVLSAGEKKWMKLMNYINNERKYNTESKLGQSIIKFLNKYYGDLEEYRTDEYPDSVFYVKDKKKYLEKNKTGTLWVDE